MRLFLYFNDSDFSGYCDSEQWSEFLEYKNLSMQDFSIKVFSNEDYKVRKIPDTKHNYISINDYDGSVDYMYDVRNLYK